MTDASDEAQVAAGANITARLGFETMSMDLPLPPRTDGALVIIGSAPPGGALPLVVDEGARGHVLADPDSAALHVWGDDAASLAAAALWLSGRAPNVWDDDALINAVRAMTVSAVG